MVFFDMILLGEAETNQLAARIYSVAFQHKIRHYARLVIFGCILYNVLVKAQTVPLFLGDWQTSL